MKEFESVLAIPLLMVAISAPALAQAQARKGTETTDIRKAKKKAASATNRKVEPKGTEAPDIRKQAR
jgi:hypothetical protein